MNRRGFFGGVIGAILAWLGLAKPATSFTIPGPPTASGDVVSETVSYRCLVLAPEAHWLSQIRGLTESYLITTHHLQANGLVYRRVQGWFLFNGPISAKQMQEAPHPQLAPGFRRCVESRTLCPFGNPNRCEFLFVDEEVDPKLS